MRGIPIQSNVGNDGFGGHRGCGGTDLSIVLRNLRPGGLDATFEAHTPTHLKRSFAVFVKLMMILEEKVYVKADVS